MLTKRADLVLVPGSPGNPGSPQQTVCAPAPSAPPAGYWRQTCSAVQLFVGWDNGPASWDNPGPFPKPIYIDGGIVCRSEWVALPVPPQPQPPPVCVTYPAIPFEPAVPARIDEVPVRAWDAGANSIDTLDGNVRVAFTIGEVLGVAIGFTQDRTTPAALDRLTHAFVFTLGADARPLAQVRESGRVATPPVPYLPDATEFEIRRAGIAVLYLRDGEIMYSSRAPVSGPLSVGCAVYGSGDRVP